MEYAIVIVASFLVYAFQHDVQRCDCNDQNVIMIDKTVLYLKEETNRKCLADLELVLSISPEDQSKVLFDPYEIKLISSTRGILSKQTVIGTKEISINQKFMAKKKETVWIEISSEGKYLVSLKTN